MSFDFLASQKRLEQRGKAFDEKTRRRAEVERQQKERAAARAAALEQAQRERRLEQAAAEQAERDHLAAELERNRGVTWRARLAAVPLPDAVAAGKGLRRAADKILLPASAGRLLMDQGAPRNGAMHFELVCPATGAHTHAGLLEFTAAEGQAALPPAVALALWGPDGEWGGDDGGGDAGGCAARTSPPASVEVRYRLLPRGERVVLQPRAAAFQAEVGPGMREALEAALGARATLTEGDWVRVGQHLLRVRELHPDRQVSVLDAELEADIAASLETEERIGREESEARRRLETLAAEALEAAREAETAAAAEAAAAEAELRRRQARTQAAAGLLARLPAEPGRGAAGCATCLLRLGDGSRHTRRFFLDGSLQPLLEWAEASGAAALPERYNLVLQYPRRTLLPPQGGQWPSLAEAGLVEGQNVIFVEALTVGDDEA
ncbi:hypothetical protein ACKKBG_A32865 [Auxenochlorella protothecoides x Auxenochlorella symbiontica]|uniref:UBX domain-containing protein n=3 Tax=Auxenochlorella protothecoides TaxID=3075 RepID=A0A3M7L3R6_AUXPR|nr:hypothetical protein APUTEX25_004061 [Auxenochlorella protothecoides]|eukprot:RMZ57227.1 hypothetical protein APUTEX25_004061 [Auxenochlorella protothecoides]